MGVLTRHPGPLRLGVPGREDTGFPLGRETRCLFVPMVGATHGSPPPDRPRGRKLIPAQAEQPWACGPVGRWPG